ncbi:MAG: hypothetical protein IJI49_04415 [Bacilli bacterium]|nr:hypothetical protein [Bacilli bacterium]
MRNIYLPPGFEWCRKAKYEVQVELACYQLNEKTKLLKGFEEKEFNDKKYAVKSGFNILEQNHWTTSPERPYIITGTMGERWPVKPSNMSAYDVNTKEIGIEPITISTKDPSNQEFMIAVHIPEGQTARILPSWAFSDDGKIDETQVMVANSIDSKVPHNGGDYVVAKHIPGQKEYWELPQEIRDTKEAAKLYSPRIINGSIMQTTYDHAQTIEEILEKYENNKLIIKK